MRRDAKAAFLEVVLGLTRRGAPARTRDIAENLGIRPSAAGKMAVDLAHEKLVSRAPGGVVLTEAGRAIALTVAERHRRLEAFLAEDLGMDARQAHREARAAERDLPAEALDLVCTHLERTERSGAASAGEGGPSASEERAGAVRALSELDEDEAGTIRVVVAGRDTRHDLMSLGFLPGVEVRVRRKLRADSLLVRIKEAEIAIGRNVAKGILLAAAGHA